MAKTTIRNVFDFNPVSVKEKLKTLYAADNTTPALIKTDARTEPSISDYYVNLPDDIENLSTYFVNLYQYVVKLAHYYFNIQSNSRKFYGL